MTNETTASQPESIGDDAHGEIRKVHHLKTDPEVFDAVTRGAKTHEIRLNDRDFQVGDRLVLAETESTGAAMRSAPKLYPLVYTGRTESRIVSHIQTGYGLADGWCILSFRAPAAQASATIQAAPTVDTITLTGHQLVAALDLLAPGLPRDPEELDGDLTFGVVQHKDDDGTVATGMCCWNDDTDGVLPLDEHPDSAATIQEPVMVAEPVVDELHFNAQRLRNVALLVGLVDAIPDDDATLDGARGAVLGMIAGRLRGEAKIDTLAAPMVADPAGVANQGAYGYKGCDTPPSGWYCTRAPGHEGPCAAWPYGEPSTPPAATVKAVPSGALDEPAERESLIACLEDDAAKLADANPDDEMVQTMKEAAEMLRSDGRQDSRGASDA